MLFTDQKKSFLLHWAQTLLVLGCGTILLSGCGSVSQDQQGQVQVTAQSQAPSPVSTPTEIMGPSFTNPVYKNDFPDPHIILVGDTYYAFSTTTSSANIRVISSRDLVTWENQGDALPALPKWSVLNSGYTWAPGVTQIGQKFVMYYVARDKEIDRQCIGVGVSENPVGAYMDYVDKALICQKELGGSIDPYPFLDDDGKLYLLWKNDGNCCGYDIWLWIQELSPDGMTLLGEPVKLIKMDQAWERPLIENPAMLKHNDKYYLFYSGNWWESHEYAIGYAVCDSVTGPCAKPLSEPWFQFNSKVMGPGGQVFFTDARGNLWMAYHAWTGADIGYPMGKRSLRIERIYFENREPVTNGPTTDPQPLP